MYFCIHTSQDYKFSDEDMKTERDDKKFDEQATAYGSLANSSEQILKEQLQWVLKGNCDKLAWRGAEVREHFRILWQNDGPLLRKIFPVFDFEVILYFFLLTSDSFDCSHLQFSL